MRLLLASILCSILAACTAPGGAATSPQAVGGITLQAVETAYQAAGQVELIYLRLPTCGAPAATAICATPEMRARIKAADNEAYSTIVAARAAADAGAPNAPAALAAASQSVSGFTAVTSTLPK